MIYVGAETRPAGPLPNCCPAIVVSRGLKPNSSGGIPNATSFDS